MSVCFFCEDVDQPPIEKLRIKRWIKKIVEVETFQLGDVSIIFCSDSFLLEMNQSYLNHDFFTDIITFDYTENKRVSGDLFLSIDRVKENAEKFHIQTKEELYRVIIHGILHLVGYKDKSLSEKSRMKEKEDECLQLLTAINQ